MRQEKTANWHWLGGIARSCWRQRGDKGCQINRQ
jgi:hypothetical protein